MDFLKKELEKKRKVIQELSGGKKYVKTSEIEKKKLSDLRQQEKKDLEKKSGGPQKAAKEVAPVSKDGVLNTSSKKTDKVINAAIISFTNASINYGKLFTCKVGYFCLTRQIVNLRS